jgi:hypothetical protein
MVPSRVEYPNSLRASAIDPSLSVHLHTIGDTVLRRVHISKNPAVAKGAVGGHVVSPDVLVGADLSSLLFLYTPVIPPGVGNIQNVLVRGESQAVGGQ